MATWCTLVLMLQSSKWIFATVKWFIDNDRVFFINNRWNAYRQAIYSQRCQHWLGDQGCCALEPDDWLKDWQWSNSYYLSGNFTLSELNTCGLICFLSRCWQGRQKEGERVSRKMEDWGIEKKNSIKWPKWVINSLVTSRTTFAASERGIQRKLKQKWLGKGGGRDHQSSALMILWAAAERGFLLSGRRRGRTSKSNR